MSNHNRGIEKRNKEICIKQRHHAARCIDANMKTLIPLCLISALPSESSDVELFALSAAILPINTPRPGDNMKARRSSQRSLICFIWTRWKECLCWLAAAPASSCEGAGRKAKDRRLCFLIPNVSAFQAAGGGRRRGTPPLGALQTWAHTGQTKAGELQAGLSPDCLSGYLRVYWG